MSTTTTEGVFICALPFASPASDAYYGERVHSNDPRFVANPGAFIPDGVPRSQWPTAIEVAADRLKPASVQARFDAECAANRILVPGPSLVRARRDVAGGYEQMPAMIAKGSVLAADHPLAVENPDAFEPVVLK
jgi:hypothetical protein